MPIANLGNRLEPIGMLIKTTKKMSIIFLHYTIIRSKHVMLHQQVDKEKEKKCLGF